MLLTYARTNKHVNSAAKIMKEGADYLKKKTAGAG